MKVPFVVSSSQPLWCHLLLTQTQDPQAAGHRSADGERLAHSDPQKNPQVPPHICERAFHWLWFTSISPDVVQKKGLDRGINVLLLWCFGCLFFLQGKKVPKPAFLGKQIQELGIGTFRNIATVRQTATLYDALSIFVERRVSALPVVDDQGTRAATKGLFSSSINPLGHL